MTAPLIGYTDRFSARPGETVSVMVASTTPGHCTADLVRIRCADPNPAGPGLRIEDTAPLGTFEAVFQPIRIGSCGIVTLNEPVALPDPCTLVVRVQPRLLDGSAQTVLDLNGLRLLAGPAGAALLPGDEVCAVAAPMVEGRWYELRCLFRDGRVELRQQPLQPNWGVPDTGTSSGACTPTALQHLVFGARAAGDGWADVMDGRLEDPAILPGWHDQPEPITLTEDTVLAWWDFSIGIDGHGFTDRGPHRWDGAFRNLPTRGVRGSHWSGAETSWRHAPRDYAAVHIHADDLYDCEWAPSLRVKIPDGLPSGVYGVRLRCAGAEDTIPLWVLPPRFQRGADIAFLASTFTYQAYANHVRFNVDTSYRARRAAWGAYPHNPEEHPDYGASTYNRHPDNTGQALSSRRRPILTIRPGFLTFDDPRGSGLRHFPADSHLTDWLEGCGFAYDVITDHDLHDEGAALLQGYRVVITGSHPEYHTTETLDALQDWTATGGRLMYMGGNGFYWRIGVNPAVPDVIEVRRAEGGIRAWAAEPCESHHQLDGAYGGLWRRNGRPPQLLVGVGFSAQGLFEGSHYRRHTRDPAYDWVFEGVAGDAFGAEGLSGGGAAGFELDRADHRLGSPPNTVVLARSEGHQAHFVPVPEELLNHVRTVSGEPAADLIRADMVLFETRDGGAVFSTGSITWCGSLPIRAYDNDVSRITANVLRRFLRPGGVATG